MSHLSYERLTLDWTRQKSQTELNQVTRERLFDSSFEKALGLQNYCIFHSKGCAVLQHAVLLRMLYGTLVK